ncbi:uncharacterized protein LY89DRAFT_445172 [Mollisia scopiformis]|uniref:Uncharacterized protein n=1 Tax=Mollisia scopiformis TaxID=149040 RepID=A0A194XK26_MOLSC|nr:uncharacterized protein LY89DRAFT_445172 [Mollisia scopiformis]KUJ20508.1 hypothetical protein LY89DRAFT_445172 [Mollisia scopiformis]
MVVFLPPGKCLFMSTPTRCHRCLADKEPNLKTLDPLSNSQPNIQKPGIAKSLWLCRMPSLPCARDLRSSPYPDLG